MRRDKARSARGDARRFLQSPLMQIPLAHRHDVRTTTVVSLKPPRNSAQKHRPFAPTEGAMVGAALVLAQRAWDWRSCTLCHSGTPNFINAHTGRHWL
jgi:hypothetical protein